MSSLFRRLPAALALALFLGSAMGSLVLAAANDAAGRASVPLLVATGIFTLVGTVVVGRRPNNVIGWLFIAIGLLWSLGTFGVEYSVYGYVTRPGAVPAPWLGAWFAEWNWMVFWYATLVVTPILFPTGRTLGPRWGRSLKVVLAVMLSIVVLAIFDERLELEGTGRSVASPLGASFGSDPDDEGSLTSYLLPVMFISAAVGLAAVVARFRRSRGDERLQIKWLSFGSCVALASFVGGIIWDASTGNTAPEIVFALGVAAIPLGAGVGILRYRLYDIDVIINRTLVYAALTATLLLAYLIIVVGLSRILDPVTQDSDIAVAASTLVVAALFRPMRTKIQSFIDRRFYRSKYDAARALADFGTRLRDEVDAEAVRDNVLGVVAHTLQPAHQSLWLVGAER